MDIPEDDSLHGQRSTTCILEGVPFFEGIGSLENTSVSLVPELHAPTLNVFMNFEGLPKHGHVNWNVVRPANALELFGGTFLDLHKHCLRNCMDEMTTSSQVCCMGISKVGNHSIDILSRGNFIVWTYPGIPTGLGEKRRELVLIDRTRWKSSRLTRWPRGVHPLQPLHLVGRTRIRGGNEL